MAADADGEFAVQALFGLFAGALEEQVAVFEADDDVWDDLFKAGIFLDDGAAAEGVVGEDEIENALEVGVGEFAGEERIDSGGGNDEDVFLSHARNLGRGERFVDDFERFFGVRAQSGFGRAKSGFSLGKSGFSLG